MTKTLPVRQPLKREPTYPGEILREDVLPDDQITSIDRPKDRIWNGALTAR